MPKPIGYYCNFKSGDGSLLAHVEADLGSNLENLSKLQKLYILSSLVSALTQAEIKLTGSTIATEEINEVTSWIARIKQHLKLGDHLGLAEAIINQLK